MPVSSSGSTIQQQPNTMSPEDKVHKNTLSNDEDKTNNQRFSDEGKQIYVSLTLNKLLKFLQPS